MNVKNVNKQMWKYETVCNQYTINGNNYFTDINKDLSSDKQLLLQGKKNILQKKNKMTNLE